MSCAPNSGCCAACGPKNLGQYPLNTGHAIPYHLTDSEIQDFLNTHLSDTALREYLESKLPEWGIIVQEVYGEFLVWFDASDVLHVVDVTNMPIAAQVKQAPFESPDSGFFANIQQSFDDLFHAVQGIGLVFSVIALGYLVWKTTR